MRPPGLQFAHSNGAHSNGHRLRDLHALLLSGGAGLRRPPPTARPLGHPVPKPFRRFGGDHSLIVETIERIARMIPSGRVSVVVDQGEVARAREQLGGCVGVTLIEQSCDRGSAAAVLLALLDVLRRAPDATIAVLPSDHGVARADLFRATIAAAALVVRDRPDAIVLVGAEPVGPDVDREWIVRSERRGPDGVPDPVVCFVERADVESAKLLFDTRRGVLNTGAVVARGMALLRLFHRQLPELTRELAQRVAHGGIAAACDGYADLAAASFATNLIGRARSLTVVSLPLAAGWTDLDDEASVAAWLRRPRLPSLDEPSHLFAFDFEAVKRLLWWRRRAAPVAPSKRPATDRAPPLVRACAWHENVTGPNVTHMICPACFERVAAEVEAAARRSARARAQPSAFVAEGPRPGCQAP